MVTGRRLNVPFIRTLPFLVFFAFNRQADCAIATFRQTRTFLFTCYNSTRIFEQPNTESFRGYSMCTVNLLLFMPVWKRTLLLKNRVSCGLLSLITFKMRKPEAYPDKGFQRKRLPRKRISKLIRVMWTSFFVYSFARVKENNQTKVFYYSMWITEPDHSSRPSIHTLRDARLCCELLQWCVNPPYTLHPCCVSNIAISICTIEHGFWVTSKPW